MFWEIVGVLCVIGLVIYIFKDKVVNVGVARNLREIQIKQIRKMIKSYNISTEELFDE